MDDADRQQSGYRDLLADLRRRLQHLHRHAGDPGTRVLAQRASRKISHATVAEVLKCVKRPTWTSLECVVKALGGDIDAFHRPWIELRNAESANEPEQDDEAGLAEVLRVFVDLARRSQVFADELVKNIEAMESGETGSREVEMETLRRLAARMSRSNEGLLLIGGERLVLPARGDPAPVAELIRQARSRIDLPGRVDYSHLDAGLRIAAHAIADMIHLLAELLDNATRYSPPDAVVTVEGARRGEVAELRIQDHGIRLPTDLIGRLNQQLRTPSAIDGTIPRMMGIAVVARLAAKHGVQVTISNQFEEGTTVDIGIPSAILEPATHPERAAWARMSAAEARQILERIEDREYKRWVLAGLAAERAEAALDATRPRGWPTVAITPTTQRPGWRGQD